MTQMIFVLENHYLIFSVLCLTAEISCQHVPICVWWALSFCHVCDS